MATKTHDPDPAAQPASVAPPRAAWTRWLTPVLAIVAALVIGLFGGVLIGKATAAPQQGGFARQASGFGAGQGGFERLQGQGQAGGQGGALAGAAITSGTIVSVEGTSITVQKQDGSKVVAKTTDATTVTTTEKSSVKKLEKGQTVIVRGATSDGAVAATSISEGEQVGAGAFQGRQGRVVGGN